MTFSPGSAASYATTNCRIYEPRRGLKINCDVIRQRHCFPRDHDYVRLFGYSYQRKTVLQNTSTRHGAFHLLKYHLQPFTTLSAGVGGSYDSHQAAEKSAEDVVYFLDFLYQELTIGETVYEEQELISVLVELSRSLQFSGRCSECVVSVDERSFHLLLKLWETAWKISVAVEARLINNAVMSSYAHVLGRLLFWDLISSIQKLSGTSCACLQETLVEVARFRASLLWDDLSKAQDEIVCLCDQEWWTLPMGCKTGVPSTLQLEIVNHLLQERVPLSPNPSYCRLLILSALTQNPDLAVSTAKTLSTFWPQNATEIIMPILDHFLANMDESYDRPIASKPGTMEKFIENDISARSLMNLCDHICSSDMKQSNVFYECLSLCAGALRGATPEGNPLRQIIGRVYLKLSRARVLAFSRSGVINFTLTMLVLARYSTDGSSKNHNLNDILKRFQERVVPPADLPLTSARVCLLVSCLSSFQLLFNLLQQPVDLAPILSFAVQRLHQESTKVHCSEVVPPLLEVLEDLATADAFNNGLILYSEIQTIYNKCSPSLRVSIQTTCSSMIDRFYKHNFESDDNPKARLSQDAFVSSTISLALPLAMTSLSQMEKYSSNYELNCAADLCAEILIGLVKWRHPLSGTLTRASFIQDVIRHVDRQPVFVVRTLALIVKKSDGETFIKVWQETEGPGLLLKLIMYVRSPLVEMDLVTRLVLKKIKSELLQVDPAPTADFMSCYQQLLCYWSRRHQELMQSCSIAEAAAFRKTVRALLRAVHFDAKAVLDLPNGQVAHLYQVVALLFSDAPDLLYTKGLADCPLPRLVETFVYPKSLLREGKVVLPRMLVECMRAQGHRFLLGLAQLFRDNDAFIGRRFSEIVGYYCKIFPQATPISLFIQQTAMESPKLTKIMLDTVWSLDIDRTAVIDVLLAILKKCSDSLSSSTQITNVHLSLLTKLASVCGAIQLPKFRDLLEACLLPCGVHCTSDQTRVIGPLMASSLCKTDAARTLPIVDLVASTWPELAEYIVHDGGIQTALSSTQNRALEQVKKKVRLLGVK
ncbi:uncharacterized protein LOC111258539 isoform X2 [Varroa jacobsoni]|uniref:uncharacterized protein LOC111258539 isoform X2 n=1 Tax=Varroa jacobsoni TaxID=62625 RepID=UPI000BF3564A|nr:uncharacterized protein LOC111258539 isoform X2 [Varroa jacobsoni]